MSTESQGQENQEPKAVAGYFVQLPSESTGLDFDLPSLWKSLLRQRILMLIIVTTCTVLAVIVALTLTPVYQSHVLLAPTATNEGQGGLSTLMSQYSAIAPLAGVGVGGNRSKDEAIAVLKSRNFTEEFIREENLMPVLFSDRWDVQTAKWDVPESDIPTLTDAYMLFDQDVRSISEDTRRNLVTLTIEWTDPVLAAEWANLLIDRLNSHLRLRDIAEAEQSIEFLDKELAKSSVLELRQGIFRLIEHQIELVMLANVRDEYAFKILDPAVASEIDRQVRPKKSLIILTGFMMGLLLAGFIGIIRSGKSQ